jgi:hypothetical protein
VASAVVRSLVLILGWNHVHNRCPSIIHRADLGGKVCNLNVHSRDRTERLNNPLLIFGTDAAERTLPITKLLK